MSLLLSLGLTARIGLGAHLCRMGRRIELCRYIRFALGNARGQARIKILAEHFIWALGYHSSVSQLPMLHSCIDIGDIEFVCADNQTFIDAVENFSV